MSKSFNNISGTRTEIQRKKTGVRPEVFALRPCVICTHFAAARKMCDFYEKPTTDAEDRLVMGIPSERMTAVAARISAEFCGKEGKGFVLDNQFEEEKKEKI